MMFLQPTRHKFVTIFAKLVKKIASHKNKMAYNVI